jgi:hypothetical protein
MLRRVALVRTIVSEELSASFNRVTRISELGITPTVTSNRRTLRRNTKWFLQEPHGVISQKTPFFIVTVVETSILTIYRICCGEMYWHNADAEVVVTRSPHITFKNTSLFTAADLGPSVQWHSFSLSKIVLRRLVCTGMGQSAKRSGTEHTAPYKLISNPITRYINSSDTRYSHSPYFYLVLLLLPTDTTVRGSPNLLSSHTPLPPIVRFSPSTNASGLAIEPRLDTWPWSLTYGWQTLGFILRLSSSPQRRWVVGRAVCCIYGKGKALASQDHLSDGFYHVRFEIFTTVTIKSVILRYKNPVRTSQETQ